MLIFWLTEGLYNLVTSPARGFDFYDHTPRCQGGGALACAAMAGRRQLSIFNYSVHTFEKTYRFRHENVNHNMFTKMITASYYNRWKPTTPPLWSSGQSS
jgi:hypothetical protein